MAQRRGGNWRRLAFLTRDLGAEQPLPDADIIGLGSAAKPEPKVWVKRRSPAPRAAAATSGRC
jgi:hypothetical protein